jgi:peptide/nickel transport system substrate-binding protein
MPNATCEMGPVGLNRNLLVNRDMPPFENPDLRHAMALSLDRQAFIDILTEGEGDIGGVMQPPPAGLWGMPPDVLQTLPGYGSDIEKNRADARQTIRKLGYGPDNRLKIKVSVRDLPYLRDPAVILTDQLSRSTSTASSKRSTPPTGFPGSCARTISSPLPAREAGPTQTRTFI